MKLLAWDTSTKAAALAAIEWDEGRDGRAGMKLVAESTLSVDASTHSERLLWGVHQVMESSRWKLDELDYLAVGVGPGSFTGLRIGVTTARTLAHTLDKKLVGVSSLAALARPAAEWLSLKKQKSLVVASTDACKGELFSLWGSSRSILDCAALADGDFPGLWKRGVEEEVLAPVELMKRVKKKLATSDEEIRWMAVGEGRKRYAEAWEALPADQEIQPPMPFPDQVQGRYVALLAWEAIQAGIARDALSVHPRYLRASDAELKLKQGLLPPGPTRGSAGE